MPSCCIDYFQFLGDRIQWVRVLNLALAMMRKMAYRRGVRRVPPCFNMLKPCAIHSESIQNMESIHDKAPRETEGRSTVVRFRMQFQAAAYAALEIPSGKEVDRVYCDFGVKRCCCRRRVNRPGFSRQPGAIHSAINPKAKKL